MSQQGKLRLQNLPGFEEAQALQNLVGGHKGRLNLSPQAPLSAFLLNAISTAVHHGKSLGLCLEDRDGQQLFDLLKRFGLEYIIWNGKKQSKSDVLNLLSKLESAPLPTPRTTGAWNRFYKGLERLSYSDFVVSHVALGEKPLYALMETYVGLHGRVGDSTVMDTINRAELEFSANEYWHVRGRIHQAQEMYYSQLDQTPQLEELHPVFFEMYRPEEAEGLVFNLLQDLDAQLFSISTDIKKWVSRYRKHMLLDLSMVLHMVRQQAFSLSSELKDLPGEGQKSDNKWGWLKRTASANQKLAEEQFLEAYKGLRRTLEAKNILHVFNLPTTDNLQVIQSALEELVTNFHKVRRKVKKHVDIHTARLNHHNIHYSDWRTSYQSLKNRLDALIREVNGKQIFKRHWEDNTLDIRSQMLWIDGQLDMVRKSLSASQDLGIFLKWKQFTSLLDPIDLRIIEVLSTVPKEEWIPLFDLWYYENFIEAQDLIPLDEMNKLGEFEKMSKALLKSQWTCTIADLAQHIQSQTTQFLKNNRKFRQWLDGKDLLSATEQDSMLEAFRDCFPIKLLNLDESGSDVNTDWIIKEGALGDDIAGIEINRDDTASIVLNPPIFKANMIRSDHTDRIQHIKWAVNFLLQWNEGLELWQDQKVVYLAFGQKGTLDLLYNWVSKDLRRLTISREQNADLLIESLLNHKGRTFYSLFCQSQSWQTGNWMRQLEKLRIMSFTSKMGFEPLFISWQSVFENAEFIATLEGEATKGQSKPVSATQN